MSKAKANQDQLIADLQTRIDEAKQEIKLIQTNINIFVCGAAIYAAFIAYNLYKAWGA